MLVVEDDHALRSVLARALREEGLDVVTAMDGRSALTSAGPRTSVVVLDIGLPDADGRDVCLALRAKGVMAPVLFLTAKDAVHDKLAGFAAGGDDYLTKPFHIRELVARLQVALRRAEAPTDSATSVRLDPARHALAFADCSVPLSPTEFRLLALLLGRYGTIVRRRELLAAGWPDGAIVHENTLDQYIARIRRKLLEAGAPDRVETTRGVGYSVAS